MKKKRKNQLFMQKGAATASRETILLFDMLREQTGRHERRTSYFSDEHKFHIKILHESNMSQ